MPTFIYCFLRGVYFLHTVLSNTLNFRYIYFTLRLKPNKVLILRVLEHQGVMPMKHLCQWKSNANEGVFYALLISRIGTQHEMQFNVITKTTFCEGFSPLSMGYSQCILRPTPGRSRLRIPTFGAKKKG